MERVQGIGGVFFKAEDPPALSRWYAEHLGVMAPPQSYDEAVWEQEQGPTVFAPFGAEQWDSPHLGPSGWGINFRVATWPAWSNSSVPPALPSRSTRRRTRTDASLTWRTRKATPCSCGSPRSPLDHDRTAP